MKYKYAGLIVIGVLFMLALMALVGATINWANPRYPETTTVSR